jgi:hypothetical protein
VYVCCPKGKPSGRFARKNCAPRLWSCSSRLRYGDSRQKDARDPFAPFYVSIHESTLIRREPSSPFFPGRYSKAGPWLRRPCFASAFPLTFQRISNSKEACKFLQARSEGLEVLYGRPFTYKKPWSLPTPIVCPLVWSINLRTLERKKRGYRR